MKYRKIIKIVFLILGIFCIFNYTQAEAKTTCTTQEKNNLIQLAHNVKFDYELSDDKSNTQGLRYYKITISNLTPGIYVTYNDLDYAYDETRTAPGIITIINLFKTNQTYYFKLYASSSTNCKDEYLVSKAVTTPAYNVYSELEECDKYPDFKLCNKNYSAKITDKQFETELEKYKMSLTKLNPEEKQTKEKTLVETIVSLYTTNWKISVPLTILLLGAIVIVIYKNLKAKKRVKIDL